MHLRQPLRYALGPRSLYFAAGDPPLQAQSRRRDAAAAGKRIEDQVSGTRPLPQERLQHREWLVVRMPSPFRRLALVVVAGGDAPDPLQVLGPRLRKRLFQEYEGGLVDAQEQLVPVAIGRPLCPEKVAGLAVAQLARRRPDGLLAEKVRPDDERPVHVHARLGQPFAGEAAIGAYVLEPEHGIAIDLHAPALVAQIAALPAPGKQAIRRIGEQE